MPTPEASDGSGGRRQADPHASTRPSGAKIAVGLQVAMDRLLPTPTANNYESEPETWQARRERERAKGQNGNGFGLTLGMAVQLLPTPTAGDAKWGPGGNSPGAGYGTVLTDAVKMLPTPQGRDGSHGGPQAKRYLNPERSNDLDDAVAWLTSEPSNPPSTDGSASSDDPLLTLWTDEEG